MAKIQTNKPLRKVSGSRWQKTRLRIIQRDFGLCQHCKRKGFIKVGHEVDHIVALCNGGTDEDSNLELLCSECHADKTAIDTGNNRKTKIGIDGWPIFE